MIDRVKVYGADGELIFKVSQDCRVAYHRLRLEEAMKILRDKLDIVGGSLKIFAEDGSLVMSLTLTEYFIADTATVEFLDASS